MGQFAVPIIMAVASAGVQAYNTNRTARKQDEAQAAAIRNQSGIQKRADERVNQEVEKLEQSRSDDERQQRMDQYMQQLSKGRDKMLAGFNPVVGSDAFKQDSAEAAGKVEQYAGDNAGLMSRIDAPGMQRQGESFGFGHLATDIGLLGRESSGQNFIDQLRASRIRRNPWLDAGAQVLGGMASSGMGTTYGGMSSGWNGQSIPGMAPIVPGMSQQYPTWGRLGLGGGKGIFPPGGP